MKNWLVGGNVMLGAGLSPWADVATFDWARTTWKVWHPVCNISIWGNAVSGNSTSRLGPFASNNTVGETTANIRFVGGDPVLDINADASIFAPEAPRLEGSDIDFTGMSRKGRLVPGPFQSIKYGKQSFKVWPVHHS